LPSHPPSGRFDTFPAADAPCPRVDTIGGAALFYPLGRAAPWQAVLHATSAADATRAMTYLFERPLDKPGDTYTRQGYANRILREHGGNKTPIANPFAHWDPNFDQKLKVFKDAKPLGSDQHSMNEIHDHRSVVNDVNIHVDGASPGDLTARPLGRPRNADLIRNTASYAS
jgi:hypothetical protein